ncbi:MAG: SDR family NAD(P)-dependent oxidoreductase [Deltaproteobacteria bacterium]|nr:SDR family NAD(P)-dependent oxidoreductase [Deltaproteobacteria bacterium]
MCRLSKNGQKALVTGGAGAIGCAIASGLLQKGYDVTIVVRAHHQGVATLDALAPDRGLPIAFEVCDLSLRREIEALSERWEGPLHVLINNAATCPRKKTHTSEGIEMQWATNVLGYFGMIKAFESALRCADTARIINVASYWAGGLNIKDPEFNHRSYDNDTAYRQAKQADRMLTRAFADRLSASHITVNSCHPGDVRSKLSGDLGFGGHESPRQGAATPLYLATDDAVAHVSGQYFAHLQPQRCGFSVDTHAVTKLHDLCESYDQSTD